MERVTSFYTYYKTRQREACHFFHSIRFPPGVQEGKGEKKHRKRKMLPEKKGGWKIDEKWNNVSQHGEKMQNRNRSE